MNSQHKYKAILCDDDEIIATGLSEFISWDDLNIELCGVGFDGLEAKELIEKYKPDILISDIRMPFLNGFEIIEYAQNINPNTVIIVISGYDDFQYAQEAIKLGAMNYLLKPIDENELSQQLKKAVEKCNLTQQHHSLIESHQKNMEKTMLQCLIFDGREEFEKLYGKEYLKPAFCCTVLIDINNYENLSYQLSNEEFQAVNETFFRCVHRQETENITIFERHPGCVGLYITDATKKSVLTMLDFTVLSIQTAFKKIYEDCSLTFFVSSVHSNLTELRTAYLESVLIQKNRYVIPQNSVLMYDKLKHFNKIRFHATQSIDDLDILATMEDIVDFIKQGDRLAVSECLNNLFMILKQNGGKSYIFMQVIISTIYTQLAKELASLNIDASQLGIDPTSDYAQIAAEGNLDTAIKLLHSSINHIMDTLEQNSQNRYLKIISSAKTYIDNNYQNHELSIDMVAHAVHMSPSHFSVIFKNETGMSFTNYLIQKQIEKSKELIRTTDMKVYEISYKVGYDTAAYFSTAFRKITGISPSDYKKLKS